jgi:hypothetical protein
MTENNKITGRFEWNADGSLFFYPDDKNIKSLDGGWNGKIINPSMGHSPYAAVTGYLTFKEISQSKFAMDSICKIELSVDLDSILKANQNKLNLHL